MRSGVQRFDSRDPPSCGVPNESDCGHGLGNPLRCQRESVKFTRQHAVRVAGPDRIIFCLNLKTSTTEGAEFHTRSSAEEQRRAATASLCGFALCNSAFSVVRMLTFPRFLPAKQTSNCIDLRFLFGHTFLDSRGAAVQTLMEANVSPQKNDFWIVFQDKFRSSTTVLRVLSPSRWTKTFLKNSGTI